MPAPVKPSAGESLSQKDRVFLRGLLIAGKRFWQATDPIDEKNAAADLIFFFEEAMKRWP